MTESANIFSLYFFLSSALFMIISQVYIILQRILESFLDPVWPTFFFFFFFARRIGLYIFNEACKSARSFLIVITV